MNPPIDAHAHLNPKLTNAEAEALRFAFVMAVTRSPSEWPPAIRRRDRRIAWGLGCHPGDPVAVRAFEDAKLSAIAGRASFLGEIGLDATSRVPIETQEQVFRALLRVAGAEGLIVSVHTAGRSARALDCIEETGVGQVILHWWGGTPNETIRAVKLGCYFSVNAAMRPDIIALLPPDRVLTETDFPATQPRDRAADRPGAVDTIEQRLADLWGKPVSAVRELEWQSIRSLDAAGGHLARATGSRGQVAT